MTYPPQVIGSIVRLFVSFRDRDTNQLIDLTSADLLCSIAGPGLGSGLVVADGVCGALGTKGWYDFDTTLQVAGQYFAQFTVTPDAGLINIEPVNGISLVLVNPIS